MADSICSLESTVLQRNRSEGCKFNKPTVLGQNLAAEAEGPTEREFDKVRGEEVS